MQEVRQSRREVDEKLESTLAEVKCEVNAAQEKMSQDVARKIGNISYQFHKKGHEHQYKFNCSVEEAISSAHTELAKVKSSVPEERESLKKVESSLEEGLKQFTTRQKHIKIADRSDFGWGTVAHYQEDLLASGPEDKKEIDRAKSHAEKDAKKDKERGANQQSRGGDGNNNKK